MRINKKGFAPIILLLVLLTIVAFGTIFYFYSKKTENNSLITSESQVDQGPEIAVHTYFSGGKKAQSIKEVNKRYADGSLETVVSSNDKQLSRQLFLRDKILSLRNGVLTQQIFQASNKANLYKTSGEHYLTLVKNIPNLSQQASSFNDEEVTVYTLGDSKSSSLQLVPQAHAAETTNITKIYIGKKTGKLKKVENIEPTTLQPIEEIVYDNGPSSDPQPLTPVPLEPKNKKDTAPEELKPIERQEEPQENISPTSVVEELKSQAKESNDIEINTSVPVVPTSEPMIIFPTSIIPTDSGYNSPTVDVISNAFKIREFSEKSARETNVFDPQEFVLKNVKIRVDGKEIPYQNFNISVDIFSAFLPNQPTGFIRFNLPYGLQAGYHTIEIFAVDTWYLAPSLMVVLPQTGEDTLELQLYSDEPPIAFPLPNNEGYRLTLPGKNIVKPFKVILSNIQGEKIEIEDKNVSVNGNGELVLSLDQTFKTGIYSLTIIKGSQTVYKPNFIAVAN